MFDLLVAGGGVIGLAVAWRAAQRGLTVAVADPLPGAGASHAAAGMLAPVSEVSYTEESLLRLGLASLRLWPAFAGDLGDVDFRTAGTLEVACDADDLVVLAELAGFEESMGLRVERLSGRECRRMEPMLAPAVRGGLYAPDDAWVDPRRVVAALLSELAILDVTMLPSRVVELSTGEVRLARGDRVRCTHVVLAAGSWTSQLMPSLPVRPVKGQILRLRTQRPFLTHCVRGLVHGSPVYLVPRGDGEVVLGATQEELGFDTSVTAGGMWGLLRDARELVPGVTELSLVEASAGVRPGTPDNVPLIGPTSMEGVYAATGHFRSGVLLAPFTAAAVTALVAGDSPPDLLDLCTPARFTKVRQ